MSIKRWAGSIFVVIFFIAGVVLKALMKASFHVEWKSIGFTSINGVRDCFLPLKSFIQRDEWINQWEGKRRHWSVKARLQNIRNDKWEFDIGSKELTWSANIYHYEYSLHMGHIPSTKSDSWIQTWSSWSNTFVSTCRKIYLQNESIRYISTRPESCPPSSRWLSPRRSQKSIFSSRDPRWMPFPLLLNQLSFIDLVRFLN